MQMLLKIRPAESLDSFTNKTLINVTADKLACGSVAILPTSTIFGLSCTYNNEIAVKKICKIKNRPAFMPFIIIISGLESLGDLTAGISKPAKKLIDIFWLSKKAQPLTLIFDRNKNLGDFITQGRPGIAVRLDPLPLLKKIVGKCGPVVSTSATISGSSSIPASLRKIEGSIIDKADIILEPGKESDTIASTILDVTGQKPVLLREGTLSAEHISQATGMDIISKDVK
jgi:L-threonylcarbamoyladenylate synthase